MFESKKKENNCPSASSLNALDSAFFSYHEIETDKNKNSFPLKLITRNSASRVVKGSNAFSSPQLKSQEISSFQKLSSKLDDKLCEIFKKELNHISTFRSLWNRKLLFSEILTSMKMKNFKKGESIFVCGDKNTDIFFIENGQVNLYYPKKKNIRPNSMNYNDLSLEKSSENFEECGYLYQGDFKPIENHAFFNENQTFCYEFARIFKFGQLIYDESPLILEKNRIGTAICSEDCDIFTLSKLDYDNLRDDFKEQNQNLIIQFLKENLPEMSNSLLFNIYSDLKFVNLKKNEKIQNSKYEVLFLVYKGSINATCEIEFEAEKNLKTLNPKRLEPLIKPLIAIEENQLFRTNKLEKETSFGDYLAKAKLSFVCSSLKAKVILIRSKKFFEIIYGLLKIESIITENLSKLTVWLERKLEKQLQGIQNNYISLHKSSQIQIENGGKAREINPISLSKKHQNKKKHRTNPNKVRSSMSKMQEKYLIMEKIFPKEETILKDTNIIPMIEPETKEKTKTLKVLSFETEQGVFIRGKMIDIDNIKEIKKKFYPLGYGELIKENRKKIRLFPFENIRDIKDKDPYKWSKENGNMLNQEKIGIRRLYTRKLTVIAAARKEIENEDNIHFHKGNSRLSSVKNLGFSVENYEKNLEKSFEPSFKMKKQKKSDKTQEKKVLNLIPLVFGERIKEKTNS